MRTALLFLGLLALAAVALATDSPVPVLDQAEIDEIIANFDARENADPRSKSGAQTIEQLVNTMNRAEPGAGDEIRNHYDNLVFQAALALGVDESDDSR